MGPLLAAIVIAALTPTPKVSAYPHFSHGPADIRLRAQRFVEAREWCLEIAAEDGPYVRSSCEQTEHAPPTTTVWFRGVPPGHYTATFSVLYLTGLARTARTAFCVNGFDITCGGAP